MNEKIKKATTFVKEKWNGFSKAVKIMLLSIPVVLIAIIVLLVILLNHKDEAVLYSGLTTQEAIEIGAAIEELGVEAQVSGGTVKVPADQQDRLRMQLAVQGYPKNSTNYDIWNSGINLWTTQGQMNEVARQQREANLASTIRQLSVVRACTVNLDIPDTKEYTINPDKKPPSCGIMITLNGENELTNNEVRAIFEIASNSVEGLTFDRISLADTQGRTYRYISKEEEEAEGRDESGVPIARKRYEFQHAMQEALLQELKDFLEPMYGKNGYSVTVNSRLNFDGENTETVHYEPSPEGDNQGVLDTERWIDSRLGLTEDGDLVGVTPNADLSPDYPTYVGDLEDSGYYYQMSEKQYDVSYIKKNVEKDGYSIENLSVALAVNTDNMSESDREAAELLMADAAGTTPDKVSVMAFPFAIPSGDGSGNSHLIIPTTPVDPLRNMLLFLVIALGIILVILLIASLFISKSRKKKIRRRQELALANAAAAAENNVAIENEPPVETDFNIASLTEEAGKESRETILKREIAEFANSSPDIVASIIRNMLRDE